MKIHRAKSEVGREGGGDRLIPSKNFQRVNSRPVGFVNER